MVNLNKTPKTRKNKRKTRKHRIRGGIPSPQRQRVSPLPFHVFSNNKNQTTLPPINTSRTSSTRRNVSRISPIVPTNETFIKKTTKFVKNYFHDHFIYGCINSKNKLTITQPVIKMCFKNANQTNGNIIDEKMATNDYSLTDDEMHLFGLNWGTECRLDVLNSQKELFVYRENQTVESTKHEFASVPHETKMDFIKLKNGPLFFFENKEGKSGGHSEIIKVLNNSTITLIDDNTIVKNPVVLFCEMAGELWLNENGEISRWNNLSGTFLPVVNVIPLLPFDKYVNELP